MNTKTYCFSDIISGDITCYDEESRSDCTYHLSSIEIPIIQRDYVQGQPVPESNGTNQLNITGKHFIHDIFEHLAAGRKMELDFIYGSLAEDTKGTYIFTPLDGQQRLTTLFLLYWYIGSRELSKADSAQLMQKLNHFTYQTRATSRRFCGMLCDKNNTVIDFSKQISSQIENLPWFHASYLQDCTIKAMLTMLDAIHEQYTECGKNLYEQLTGIRFYIMVLNNFNLTDDLYIKMNARGKPLTGFENFKADLIHWMKSDKNSESAQFNEKSVYGSIKMPYYLAFSNKIDNEWTNYFWNEIKDKSDAQTIDPLFMRFINRYFCNIEIIKSGKNAAEIEDSDNVFNYFYGSEGDDSGIVYSSFEPFKRFFTKKQCEKFEKLFAVLNEHGSEIKKVMHPCWDEKNDDTPWIFYDKEITQRQRVAFYAAVSFIEKQESFDSERFNDWMRFVWNMISDPGLRTISRMISALRFVESLLDYADDINKYLAGFTAVDNVDELYRNQFAEECIKAKLIVLTENHEAWRTEIVTAESHPLFRGRINVLLSEAEHTSIQRFSADYATAAEIFSKYPSEKNYLWIRSTLAEAESVTLPIDFDDGQFYHWRDLVNDQLQDSFRRLIAQLKMNKESVEDQMEKICTSYTRKQDDSSWIYPLVQWENGSGKSLLDYSETKHVQQYNNYGCESNNVYLYNKTRWTEGNILLSTFRNEITAEIIKQTGAVFVQNDTDVANWDWGNICGAYFRGWDVRLSKTIQKNGMTFVISYLLDRENAAVGILETEENKAYFADKPIRNQNHTEWICMTEYDFSAVDSTEKAAAFARMLIAKQNEIIRAL